MSIALPTDPRHGTDRGHAAHMRAKVPPCEACIRAHGRMNKVRNLYPERYRKVPVLGSRRRIQALQALGYGRDRLAREMGYDGDGGSIAYIMSPKSKTVTQATDRRIREVFARLSMVTPPTGAGASRARTWAKRNGYAPPLAWDDIDDPSETPKGIGTSSIDRADVLADVDSWGGNATDAARALGIDRAALQTWAQRHGCSELYRRLAGREAMRGNQWTEGAA